MPKLVIPVTEKEYKEAGSKFITFDQTDAVGKIYQYPIELGEPGWKQAGVSVKFPVTITEGIDSGKQDEMFAGISANAIWKFKEIHRNVTGTDPVMQNGKPVLDTELFTGKPAVGVWRIEEGHKDGNPNNPVVKYPKLVSILPAAAKTESA